MQEISFLVQLLILIVNAIVKVELPSNVVISSSITLEAVDELDLTVGTEVTAVVKASEVLIMA